MTFLFKACALLLAVVAVQAEMYKFSDPASYQRHFHRAARAAKPQWSSSSSSSSSSSGGSPVYFGGQGSASTFSSSSGYNSGGYQPGFQQQSFGFPDFGFGFPGAFGAYPQQSQYFGFGDYGGGLGVRLGAGPSVHVAASQHSNQPGGVYSSSSSGVDSNGNVHFHAEKGRF